MYALLRRLLFGIEAEKAHDAALTALDWLAPAAPLLGARRVVAPVSCLGLRFPNAVGLAAGLDKNGDHLDALGRLGFGFIEVGTVTPRPQPGNPRPRLFRVPEVQALINRFGFNNRGVGHLVKRLERTGYRGVIGVNIGKNRDTPVEDALDDYRRCLEAVYPHADYVVVNVSSPNTPGLRGLQRGAEMQSLLAGLKTSQQHLESAQGRRVPLVLKVAPDLDEQEMDGIAQALLDQGIEGLTATNTTLERPGLDPNDRRTAEAGGLSGAPLRPRATAVLRAFRERLGPNFPIIGVGGIGAAAHAVERRDAGAQLVQIYTGLIYRGPALIHECARALATPR